MPSFSSTFSIFKSSKKNTTKKTSSSIMAKPTISKSSNKKTKTATASNGKNIDKVNKNPNKNNNKDAKDSYSMSTKSVDKAIKSPNTNNYNNNITTATTTATTTTTNNNSSSSNSSNDYNTNNRNTIAIANTEPVDLGIPRRGQYITRDGIDVVAVLETWHQIYTGWQIVSAELDRKEKMRQRHQRSLFDNEISVARKLAIA
ncbi:mitotic spindle checkpoint protein Bub3 [Aspergillus brasiliensis]|nr:mitotic spindle checkpoint protein Bub3 [Aspergillus brasiliensis]